jgi:hypothetical protein
MMKLVIAVALLAVCGMATVAVPPEGIEEGEYYFEWEYYTPEAVVDTIPEQESYDVSITESRIDEVSEDQKYIEYEYQYEYEYEGHLVGGGGQGSMEVEEICPTHFVSDCQQTCAPAYWIGNGLCDNGGINTAEKTDESFPFESEHDVTFMPDTGSKNLKVDTAADRKKKDRIAYDFDCVEFWNDGGDCTSKSASIQELYDERWMTATSLQIGGKSFSVPTVAIAAMAVVGIVGVAMRR